MTRVQLVDIAKRYGDTVAVELFNADIADGELVTLLGPSGCGKTTTLRMVAGLVDPTAGLIKFDDQVVNRVPTHKRNIGLAFQSHALFPHMSVAKNIAFGLTVKRRSKQEVADRVEAMLEMVELDGYGDRTPAQLSGGQQQRVALARMLATDPRVLLFDEPLSALDRNLRDSLKYSILDLQRRSGKTAIYVTHDQSEAFAISDRIFVMNAGLVEQVGTQLDIYLRPATEFVANFVGDNNTLHGTVRFVERDVNNAAIVTVDCGSTAVRGVGTPDMTAGDSVIAFIRPENIRVLQDAEARDSDVNILNGTIESIVFEGPVVRLNVDANGEPLKVMVSGVDRLTLLDAGERNYRFLLQEVALVRDQA